MPFKKYLQRFFPATRWTYLYDREQTLCPASETTYENGQL